MKIDIAQFRGVFFEEAAEHLATMEVGLLQLEQAPNDRATVDAVFRGAHSIKGAAGTFGFLEVASFLHGVETLLDRMRSGTTDVTPRRITLLLGALDALQQLLSAAREDAPLSDPAQSRIALVAAGVEAECAGAHQATAGQIPYAGSDAINMAGVRPGAGSPRTRHLTIVPTARLLQTGLDPALLLRDLATLGTITNCRLHDDRVPQFDAFDAESCYVWWTLDLETIASDENIHDVFVFADDDCEVRIEDGAAARDAQQAATDTVTVASGSGAKHPGTAVAETTSLRVPAAKIDTLVDLVGELVIAQSMVRQLLDGFTSERLPALLDAVTAMERDTHELQERIMGIRMVPIGSVFSRFPRMVRDVAAACGKQITLRIDGQETEIDKGMVERLGDPLTHLVRNCIDHGLEPSDERVAMGKPPTGELHLSARHEGGSVIIEVADDGRGLNTARIRAKAERQGLVRPEDVCTTEYLHGLIFEPGFSTNDEVTDLSGRGVGMDVVKRVVDSMNGTISLASRPGQGTRFRFKLPLTLAILDGLALRVGEQTFIVPLLAVTESFRPTTAEHRSLVGRGEIVLVRGEAVPLVRLNRQLHVPDACETPSEGVVVIVEHDGRRLGLLVDELLGQAQVVLKSLEVNYHRVDGVLGATILGNGSVALILDIAGLERTASRLTVEGLSPAQVATLAVEVQHLALTGVTA